MCSHCGLQLASMQQQSLAGIGYQGGFWSSLMGNIGSSPYEFAAPDDGGWYEYCECPAPPNALCQFRQQYEGVSLHKGWTGYSRDFGPEFNIANLKWRYTGIAKEERGL